MRVPIPLAILLCLLVIAGMWWGGTRNDDFLAPPPADQLAALRQRTEESYARQRMEIAPPVVEEKKEPAPPVEAPLPPTIELGDLATPPTLEAYSERARDGHPKLAELAALLEKEGHFQRALLAWERSIDLATPTAAEATVSLAAIHRLRPTLPDWNTDPNAAFPVVLHAGTGPALANALRPLLEEAAREITIASSGLLHVTADLAVGKRMAAKGPVPVAVWLSGPTKDATSTDVLSFTVATNDVLKTEVYRTVFQLVSGQLKRAAQFTPPVEPADGQDPLDALQSNITRLSWREFGKSLGAPPAAAPAR